MRKDVRPVTPSDVLHLTNEMLQQIQDCKSSDDWPSWLQPSILDSRVKTYASKEAGRYANASAPIQAGEIVVHANGTRIDRPHRWSIQVDKQLHVTGTGAINHVCAEPTLIVDPETNNFLARRDIEPGEEMNVNYFTFERAMSSPFACDCKHHECFGSVQGFEFLSEGDRAKVAERYPILPYLVTEVP
jgi:hypothetical protein